MTPDDGITDISQLGAAPMELPEYQSISTLAVVAFLLGVLSLAAFALPMLSAVSVVAVLTALAALAGIKKSAGRLTGAGLARFGLALAIVFGVGATVRRPVRNAALQRQAQAAVDAWIHLLAERRLEDSLDRLSQRGHSRLHPQAEPGQGPPPADELREYMLKQLRDDPVVARLADAGDGLRVTQTRQISPPTSQGNRITLQNVYRLEAPGESSRTEPLLISVQLTRAPAYETNGVPLRIDDWGLAESSEP